MKNNMPPIHPGRHVKMALEDMKMSNAQAARILDVTAAYVGGIVNGKRNLSADMCWKLAGLVGSTPEHWMALQDQYDMKMSARNGKLKALRVEVGRRLKVFMREEARV